VPVSFQREPDDFDLLIADQVMPEMTGMELTRDVLEETN
jgi:CheY-like chemotaxis protein